MATYQSLSSNGVTYGDTLTGRTDLLYYLNDSDASNGFVFELASLDISGTLNVDPSFQELLTESSDYVLGDCSAVLEFDVSLSQFQGLFSIQIDSSDVDDISADDVLFRVNQPLNDDYNDISDTFSVGKLFNDISYSNAVAKFGRVNNYYQNQEVKYDFVRHIAKEITGGYSSSDIFTNESALVDAVSALDVSIAETFNSVISDMSGIDWQPATYTGNHASMIKAAHRLYNLNLQHDSTIEDAPGNRTYKLLSDISAASANVFNAVDGTAAPLRIPLRFEPNDRIAVRLEYKPNSNIFPGNNATINSRAYKVFFRLVE